jgi:tungstate transport system substrate-binding protein
VGRKSQPAVYVRFLAVIGVIAALAAGGLVATGKWKPGGPAKPITLATTTSTQDSGLLDVLLPAFTKATGIQVKSVAVGSGEAIAMGQRGDADVLLTHSPAAEEKFVADGFGVNRKKVMYNDYVLLGPATDPAGIKGMKTAGEALKKVAAAKSPFVSRGDKSGTHTKELSLWAKTGLQLTTSAGMGATAGAVRPAGEWYLEAGQGMGAVLKMASEKKAYTLADRATYLANKGNIALAVLVEGDTALFNPYTVIGVNPAKHPKANAKGAEKFIAYITSEKGQKLIAEYGKDKYGQALFYPDAGK